jgi:hypothetical protein
MIEAEYSSDSTYYLRSKLDGGRIKSIIVPLVLKNCFTHINQVEGRLMMRGFCVSENGTRLFNFSWNVSVLEMRSLMERSDKTNLLFNREAGKLDARADTDNTILSAPYTLGLTIHELEAMHISVDLVS